MGVLERQARDIDPLKVGDQFQPRRRQLAGDGPGPLGLAGDLHRSGVERAAGVPVGLEGQGPVPLHHAGGRGLQRRAVQAGVGDRQTARLPVGLGLQARRGAQQAVELVQPGGELLADRIEAEGPGRGRPGLRCRPGEARAARRPKPRLFQVGDLGLALEGERAQEAASAAGLHLEASSRQVDPAQHQLPVGQPLAVQAGDRRTAQHRGGEALPPPAGAGDLRLHPQHALGQGGLERPGHPRQPVAARGHLGDRRRTGEPPGRAVAAQHARDPRTAGLRSAHQPRQCRGLHVDRHAPGPDLARADIALAHGAQAQVLGPERRVEREQPAVRLAPADPERQLLAHLRRIRRRQARRAEQDPPARLPAPRPPGALSRQGHDGPGPRHGGELALGHLAVGADVQVEGLVRREAQRPGERTSLRLLGDRDEPQGPRGAQREVHVQVVAGVQQAGGVRLADLAASPLDIELGGEVIDPTLVTEGRQQLDAGPGLVDVEGDRQSAVLSLGGKRRPAQETDGLGLD